MRRLPDPLCATMHQDAEIIFTILSLGSARSVLRTQENSRLVAWRGVLALRAAGIVLSQDVNIIPREHRAEKTPLCGSFSFSSSQAFSATRSPVCLANFGAVHSGEQGQILCSSRPRT